jgi:hypothetical protein
MKKIAIITLYDLENFGNRLQNFALQKILKNQNLEVSTIFFNYPDQPKSIFIKFLLKIYKVIKFILYKRYRNHLILKKEKINKFLLFNNDFIHSKIFNYKYDDLIKLNNEFDFFIVGSDQVWNPNYLTYEQMQINFLRFTTSRKKKSYAASFGLSELPPNFLNTYSKYLADFSDISVREFQGKKLVFDLTKKIVDVHLDPTLLLNSKDWDILISKSTFKDHFGRKYILTYLIGNEGKILQKQFEIISKAFSIDVINIYNISDSAYNINPCDFLSLFKNAYYVFTNSYHGTIFSIIYRKHFKVIHRYGNSKNINSRIISLLEVLGLSNRLINSLDDFSLSSISYTSTFNEKLFQEQEKALSFLNNLFRTAND